MRDLTAIRRTCDRGFKRAQLRGNSEFLDIFRTLINDIEKVENIKDIILRVIQLEASLEHLPGVDDTLEALSMDSLTLISIIMELEKKLKIQIKDELMQEWETVRDIINYTEKVYKEQR